MICASVFLKCAEGLDPKSSREGSKPYGRDWQSRLGSREPAPERTRTTIPAQISLGSGGAGHLHLGSDFE